VVILILFNIDFQNRTIAGEKENFHNYKGNNSSEIVNNSNVPKDMIMCGKKTPNRPNTAVGKINFYNHRFYTTYYQRIMYATLTNAA
jgi:hypothetical protein